MSDKKTWNTPKIVDTPIVKVLGKEAKNKMSMLLLFAFSFLNAQSVTITEGCSNGSIETFALIKTGVSDSGYNTYTEGSRLLEFNSITKRWEYSKGGVIYFTNTVKNKKPLAPCSFKFPFKAAQICTDTLFSLLTDCEVLPVELSKFVAYKSGSNVVLNWVTLSEVNNDRFEIEQSGKEGIFRKIGTVQGKGQAHNYTFEVSEYSEGVNYFKLKQIDTNGKTTAYFRSIEIEETGIYTVYDFAGRVILRGNKSDIQRLQSGFYVVQNRSNTFKYFKQ